MVLREPHLAEKVFSGTWGGKNVTFVNSKKKKKKFLKLCLNQELENLRNFGWRTISLY